MRTILDDESRRVVLLHGDADALDLGENSVDSIVSDPPAAISFMGQDWDDDRGGRDGWCRWLARQYAPSFRALKPGGHGLIWALPRTSHWTATALELCGFEIRDVVHDVLSLDPAVRALVESLDPAQRLALARCFEGVSAPIFYQLFGQGFPKSLTSASAEIPEWAGTALKPAVEHWILARKPLDGTVAANVLEHGTGVLNVGGCRVAMSDEDRKQARVPNPIMRPPGSVTWTGTGRSGERFEPAAAGRWPAHLTLDESGAVALDEQSGELTSGHRRAGVRQGRRDGQTYGDQAGDGGPEVLPSRGGASRFFYVAKPARSEKERGLDHLAPSTGGEATGREDGSAGTRNPRAGAGRTGGARNVHPTVKSVELMRWLCRLVTPPGGVVLDPFAGSGTTGVAAIAEGFGFVGVEQGGPDDKYLPILIGRIEQAIKDKE